MFFNVIVFLSNKVPQKIIYIYIYNTYTREFVSKNPRTQKLVHLKGFYSHSSGNFFKKEKNL